DDMQIRVFNYNTLDRIYMFEAHCDYIRCVWQLGSKTPNFTLEGHEKGVNCIDYYNGGDKPYLISGADDQLVKIWDYQEEPAMSMDSGGKIMLARHSEVQQANLKVLGETEIQDGEKLPLGVKDMGSCEIYPQTIQHSPNGR
ncbi:hypothetical protein GOODEAATRI_017785, partial [Goodea atripinnis]